MEEEVKNNYVLGVIGALIGALIGAIPWILCYVFANMIYAILSIVIVLGGFYGYKLTKAKIDKKLPIILSIVSFISITVTMFIFIPLAWMAKEEIPITMDNFMFMYQYDEFTGAIIGDYIISLLFCILVISGIIYNLNKQIKQGVDSKDIKILTQDASNDAFSKEDIEKVKNIFEKNDAMDKKHLITRELVMEDIEKEFGADKGNKIFEYLKAEKIIKKKSSKFYFSEKAQNSAFYRYGLTNLKTVGIILAIAIIAGVAIVFFQEREEDNSYLNAVEDGVRASTFEIEGTDITLDFGEEMTILSNSEIVYYFGSQYANVYDCLAISEDFEKMIMVFENDKVIEGKEYTAEEFLKVSMNDENLEIQESEISGHKFYIVNTPYETEDGTEYIEQTFVYDNGEKFICIIFDSLASNPLDPNTIIK